MWFAVLEHRLERIIEDSGASPPFDEAYAGCFSFEGAPMATFTAYPPEQEGWAAALERLLVEVLRLARHGPVRHELERCRGE